MSPALSLSPLWGYCGVVRTNAFISICGCSAVYEVGTDGITRNADAGSCTDYNANLPTEFGLNQKYAGTIEIVVPEASGVLALQTSVLQNGGGWEWAY